jgi:hypothetical protein
MTIAFECPKCGRGFMVASAHSGRRARCKGCGEVLTVPPATADSTTAEFEPESDTYALEEIIPPAEPIGQAAFVPAPADSDQQPNRSHRAARAKLVRQAKREAVNIAARVVPLLPWLLGVPAATAFTLGLVAAIIPGGTMIAGSILAVAGIVLLLSGYGLGAYVAFTEDSLYGILYLIFPPYTAYYIVMNWNEMWPSFALTITGAATLTIAIVIMGAGLEKDNADGSPVAARCQISFMYDFTG